LRGRGFDPERLKRLWGISSTGYTGYYAHRIFAPIVFGWQEVSFTCRSPIKQVRPRYLSCGEEAEVIPHKHIVYGFDYAVEKRICVVVEGATDVWRLGPGAVALFGQDWTPEQVLLLANNFDKAVVMLDASVSAHVKGKLANGLYAHGMWSVDVVDLAAGDPGDLSDEEAAEIMGDLGF
jgi:hypothetical protein